MADYIPITDQEIEPESPITSILQHKLRDNPLAMFEGTDGAPKLSTNAFADNSIVRSKMKIGAGQVNIFNGIGGNYVRPSGALQVGEELSSPALTSGTGYCNGIGTASTVAVSRGAYCSRNGGGTTSTMYLYNSYNSVSFDTVWFFISARKDNGEIAHKWFCNHHPSYGQSSFFEHPFPDIDLSVYDIFCINITKEDHEKVLYGQYPTGLDPLVFFDKNINTFSEINPFRGKRGLIESFLDNFEIVFSDLLPWVTGEFPVGMPDFELGFDFTYTAIPEPSNVTRVGYVSK